ncbi:MAG: DUF937 domain-containing protein [Acidobacteriota bacterium]
MNLVETILNQQNGAAVRQIESQFGLEPQQSRSAIEALVPALAVGLQQNAQSAGGLQELLAALSSGGHEQYVEDPTMLERAETLEDGNGILSHVFGNKEVSRQVASRAAKQTGLGADLLKRMLPMVATLVMGTLARRTSQAGAQGTTESGGAGGLMGLLGGALDQNRDGSMVDDVIGILGRTLGR